MTEKYIEGITEYINHMKFRKKFFMGVDEGDVLNKISELNEKYKMLLEIQEASYKSLLDERDREIEKLRAENEK